MGRGERVAQTACVSKNRATAFQDNDISSSLTSQRKILRIYVFVQHVSAHQIYVFALRESAHQSTCFSGYISHTNQVYCPLKKGRDRFV
jgi:hypothetical protein